MTWVINSGQIASVPFPLTESGLSIIDALATIEFDCSAGDVYVVARRSAETSGTATTSAGIVIKSLLGATTEAGAVATNTDISLKVAITPIAQSAGATCEASAVEYLKPTASTTAGADQSATAYLHVIRSAATAARASGAVTAGMKVSVAPENTAAMATCSASATMLRRTGGSTSAGAVCVSGLALKYSLSAAASAYATCDATAVDYASTILAPDSRRMTLPASTRTMEYTQ